MSREDYELKKAAIAELTRMSKANGGKITAEQVVSAARDDSNPLHEYFEWNDDEAAEKYRLMQARTLLRSCHYQVTVHERKIELPYYTRDPEAEPMTQGYVEVARLRGQEDIAREVIIREFSRAASQLRKARNMARFFELEGEIDEMIERLDMLHSKLTETQAAMQ